MEPNKPDLNELYKQSIRYQVPYTWKDVILYALGANARAEQLGLVNEFNFKPLPTYPMVCLWYGPDEMQDGNHRSIHPYRLLPLFRRVIYGMSGGIKLYKPIDPMGGVMNCEGRLISMKSRGAGKGYVAEFCVEVRDSEGELLAVITETDSYDCPYDLGVSEAERPAAIIPDREADLHLTESLGAANSAIHRLCGNKSIAHYSPATAAAQGLDGIYLAGVNIHSIACRMLTDALLPGEEDRVTEYYAVVRGHCFNNEALDLDVWRLSDCDAAFRLTKAEDGNRILDQGHIIWK